jgi:hypothetical protein
MTEWISSLAAVQRLRAQGLENPETTLGLWAEAGFLRSRASWGRFSHEGGVDELHFSDAPHPNPVPLDASNSSPDALSDAPANPDEQDGPSSWPEISNDFWHYVNVKNGNAVAHYEAGIFAALVVLDPEIDTYSGTEHVKLFGVSFHSANLDALLHGVGERQVSQALSAMMPRQRGPKPDLERYSEFGAALALHVHSSGSEDLRSTNAVYKAVAASLMETGRDALDINRVKPMIHQAQFWIEAGKVLPKV